MRFPKQLSLLMLFGVGLVLAVVVGYGVFHNRKPGHQSDGSILLPTGQEIRPAGSHLEVSDRPMGMTLSPDGKVMAVSTGSNFSARSLHLVDPITWQVKQSIPLKDSFVGLAFSAEGDRIFVGGGRAQCVYVFARQSSGKFALEREIAIPDSDPSGLSLSRDGTTLYVALNLKHALGVVDVASGSVREVDTGVYPFTTVLSTDGHYVYVSNWGGRKPRPGDPTDGEHPVVVDPRTGIAASGSVSIYDRISDSVVAEIETGLHPCSLALSPDGKLLYVTNANSDSVTVIDVGSRSVARTLDVRLFSGAPLGSSPNALAVSPDGKTLYVANAADNAVAVVDPTKSKGGVRGFIPTGWYPMAVALDANGQSLFVASGYGFGSIAPARAGRKPETGRSFSDRKGVISKIATLDALRELSAGTRTVMQGDHAAAMRGERFRPTAGHPIPVNVGDPSPIKHVIYVIKENRTYDQILGDLPQGNGDAALVHFGRDVTPNHHAIAEEFVLLDNFYVAGDQSSLGHRWSTQGYASDYNHRFGNDRRDLSPMLFAPTDFLWDNAKKHGKSVLSYGERGRNRISPAGSTWMDFYQDWKSGANRIEVEAWTPVVGLQGVLVPDYPAYGLNIPDQVRAEIFLRDFRKFEEDGNLPELIVLLLPADHTSGSAPGSPTPRAMVADNDLALGRVVEAVSKSKYWPSTAVFVVEDDAQAGLDHVDGHRTVALVASPYTKRGAVDSTFYNTINMYRTIEQILGLTPQNQFDLAAEPMFSIFQSEPDLSPYALRQNKIALDEMNPPAQALKGIAREHAIASAKMNFTEPDAAPEQLLNRIVWHSVKGYQTRYPEEFAGEDDDDEEHEQR